MLTDLDATTLFPVDDQGRLFISPAIVEWEPIYAAGIRVIIDLDGGLDAGVSSRPGHIIYLYHPIYDEDLPHLETFHSVARFAADLIRRGERVLAHCGMGFNRSALMAGVILTEIGLTGGEAVNRLRERRPGALFNETFADYLASLPAKGVESL
jgi:protein-tyrosine phosphatase